MANISTVSTPFGSPTHAARKPGVFRRFLQATIRSRQLKADREIAEILAWRGGVLPREIWREMEGARLAYPIGHGEPAGSR